MINVSNSRRAFSTRAVASVWWFFTLILVSSYTANLAAFLTVESLVTPIEDADDLSENKGGVNYGAKNGGSTFTFFKVGTLIYSFSGQLLILSGALQDAKYPTYQKMYEFMKDNPEFMTNSNQEGVDRVENSNYAFLMESTTIEYITERRCTLTQVGALLDEKGYGIAMRKSTSLSLSFVAPPLSLYFFNGSSVPFGQTGRIAMCSARRYWSFKNKVSSPK